jgi:hypothetical protein
MVLFSFRTQRGLDKNNLTLPNREDGTKGLGPRGLHVEAGFAMMDWDQGDAEERESC